MNSADVMSSGPCAFCSSRPGTTCEFVLATNNNEGYSSVPVVFIGDKHIMADPSQTTAFSSTVSGTHGYPYDNPLYPPNPISTQLSWEDAAIWQNPTNYLGSQKTGASSDTAGQLRLQPFTPNNSHTARDDASTGNWYFQDTATLTLPQQESSMVFQQQFLGAPPKYNAVSYSDDQRSYFEQRHSIDPTLEDNGGMYGVYGDPSSLATVLTSSRNTPYPPTSEHYREEQSPGDYQLSWS